MSPQAAADRMVAALRARGARIGRVRYRENRSVLLSVSRDGRTLNSHVCFRSAPPRILDAIALFLRAPRGSEDYRRALATIVSWEGAEDGLRRARSHARPRAAGRRDDDAGTGVYLEALYQRLNRERFAARLPAVPLRVSRRMTRSLGTIAYGRGRDGRRVREIALSADLLRSGNRRVLLDTLLHEMAHAEAWLEHGHRGHGPVWRRIAERVGCTPRAIIAARVRGRTG